MKRKNFKYILIFIFIVCLLIPVSCINIFATTYNYYYSFNDTQGGYIYINITNCDYLKYENNIYYGESNLIYTIRLIINNNNSNSYYLLILKTLNGSTTTINSIYNGVNQGRYSLLDKFEVYYNNNTTIQIVSNKNNNYLSGYGTAFTKSTYYNVNNILNNNNYTYFKGIRSGYYIEYDIKFINQPSSISFDKTYNLSFYNNDILYDSITISGASASGYAPFEEISQIKYGNTIVYDNSIWSSGYNSTLKYNQLMTEPNITTINSDCNSIITFTTQYYVDTISFFKTYNVGTFYNDTGQSNEYSSITIIGKVANGTITPFLEISQIKYDSTLVYDNNTWVTGYSNYLYTNVGNTLSLNSINTDCNNIITFVNYYIDARIYNIGTFFIGDNSNTVYSKIQVKGSPNSNNTFSSIDIISYDSTIVYQNGTWVSGYSPNLKYFSFSDLNITELNYDCNDIVTFTKTQIDSVDPNLQNNILNGIDIILLPITSLIQESNNNIVVAIVLMFMVVNFAFTIVFIFIKVKNRK